MKENMQISLLCLIKFILILSFIPVMGNMQTIQSFVINSTILCSKHEPNTILTILCEHASLLKFSLLILKKVSSSVVYKTGRRVKTELELNYVLNTVY